MTYNDIYEEFCKKFGIPYEIIENYRPAVPMHVPELEDEIPGGILIWFKDGSKIIYISKEAEAEANEAFNVDEMIYLLNRSGVAVFSEYTRSRIAEWLKELKGYRKQEQESKKK